MHNETVSTVIDTAAFSKEIDGKRTGLYTIRRGSVKAWFTNYGARLVGLTVPDRNGKPTDVVVGLGSIDDYLNSTEPYFGATIGRYGNRIANGRFTIDDHGHQITINNGPHALHGGKKGFQDVIWDVSQSDSSSLVFTYLSPDGEEGFPGNLKVKVRYSLAADQSLKMEYEAITDKKTHVNLTNHAFFNLNGEGNGDILNHRVQIFADTYLPVDSTLIPTGEIADVADTPFDFTEPSTIGSRIEDDHLQLKNGKGYDHTFILTGSRHDGILHAATVTGDRSGIKLDIFTREPGMQFYSGNFMAGRNKFKGGSTDQFRTAFAMETQHFPDSPNKPSFPSTLLSPGEKYHTVSVYRFSID